MRTAIAIGPYHFSSARMFVNAYPEKSLGNTQVWTGACDVIAQADRIDAAVGQIGVFFNPAAASMMPPTPTWVPTFEGMSGGYPRYNGWIYISKNARLPWVPETLAQRLGREIAGRERKLAEWMSNPVRTQPPQPEAATQKTYDMLKKSDPQGAEQYLDSVRELDRQWRHKVVEVFPALTRQLEKSLAEAKRYQAAFSAADLAMPAVSGDPLGTGKAALDARITQLHALSPGEQQQTDEANRAGRALERRAQEAARTGNQAEADALRARVAALSAQTRAIKKAHLENIEAAIGAESAAFELASLRPGEAKHALAFVPDPDFYDKQNPQRIQLITLLFSSGKRAGGAQWMKRAHEGFDIGALARMLD